MSTVELIGQVIGLLETYEDHSLSMDPKKYAKNHDDLKETRKIIMHYQQTGVWDMDPDDEPCYCPLGCEDEEECFMNRHSYSSAKKNYVSDDDYSDDEYSDEAEYSEEQSSFEDEYSDEEDSDEDHAPIQKVTNFCDKCIA